MAFGFSKNRVSPIGVDFGAGRLKMMQLALGDRLELVAAAEVELPEGSYEDATARRAAVANGLRDALNAPAYGAFRGRRAICSIPAFQTLVLHLEVGSNGDDLRLQVNLHLQERMGIDPTRMVLRHHVVGEAVRGGQTQQDVICLGARRDLVMQYINAAQNAKLEVVGMHSEPPSLLTAFNHLSPPAPGGPAVALIDLGAATASVLMLAGGKMRFAKTVHLRDAVPAAAAPVGVGGGSDPAEQTEMAAGLVEDLRMCLRYDRGVSPTRPVEKLVFVGGRSRDTALCRSIAQELRMAAQRCDPVARLAPGEAGPIGDPQPGWTLAMGLCLSEANL